MIVPVDRAEARAMVDLWHRHHDPHVAEKLALGWMLPSGELVACVVAGRPIAGPLDQRTTWEVTRLCVGPDAPRFAASRLLGAIARAAESCGVTRLVSYTRFDERGTCYRAAGWHPTAVVRGRPHNTGNRAVRWLPGLYEPSTEIVDRVRWERGPAAAPAVDLQNVRAVGSAEQGARATNPAGSDVGVPRAGRGSDA